MPDAENPYQSPQSTNAPVKDTRGRFLFCLRMFTTFMVAAFGLLWGAVSLTLIRELALYPNLRGATNFDLGTIAILCGLACLVSLAAAVTCFLDRDRIAFLLFLTSLALPLACALLL